MKRRFLRWCAAGLLALAALAFVGLWLYFLPMVLAGILEVLYGLGTGLGVGLGLLVIFELCTGRFR